MIDALEGATDSLVWHGSARVEIEPDQIDEERLHRAVVSVLANFPPRPPERTPH